MIALIITTSRGTPQYNIIYRIYDNRVSRVRKFIQEKYNETKPQLCTQAILLRGIKIGIHVSSCRLQLARDNKFVKSCTQSVLKLVHNIYIIYAESLLLSRVIARGHEQYTY